MVIGEGEYILVNERALPEIYTKVLRASALLESGEAASASEAAKLAGISRSVFYKYKDNVFAYEKHDKNRIITVQVLLIDRPGVLMNFLAVFYKASANILTVNQNIPVKGRAFVSVSARTDGMRIQPGELISKLREVDGVIKVDGIAD